MYLILLVSQSRSRAASQSESFVTSSDFYPYVTQVGLYDDFGQLLVVGKLGKPIKLSTQLDTTFVVRFDV